jgi:hypothetical protein
MIRAEHDATAHDPAVTSPSASDPARDRPAGKRKNRNTLTPFTTTDGRASAAGKRSAELRRERAQLLRTAQREPLAQLEHVLATVERDELGPIAAAAAVHMIGQVVAGHVKVRDPAAWVRVLVDVARLEAGEVTSATAHLTIAGDDVARALELRDAARRAVGLGAVVDVADADAVP